MLVSGGNKNCYWSIKSLNIQMLNAKVKVEERYSLITKEDFMNLLKSGNIRTILC